MEVSELYQELVIDHGTQPRNSGKIDCPSAEAKGINPLCGDEIELQIIVDENEVITDLKFDSQGCAISTASASLLSEVVLNKKIEDAVKIFDEFHKQLMSSDEEFENYRKDPFFCVESKIEKLNILLGVRAYPSRIKCAVLGGHTLKKAVENWYLANQDKIESKVISKLKTIYDPELPVNIYDLKLIYDIKINNSTAEIKMTLTTPACPVAQSFPEEVKNKVKEVPGIKEANVELVWEPAWSPDLLSEDIKLELGII